MSTTLDKALLNIAYRVEAIRAHGFKHPNDFTLYDLIHQDAPDGSAGLRFFSVEWSDSDADTGATDMTAREAFHHFLVRVKYPMVLPFLTLQRMVLHDRHDITHALRHTDSFLGWRDEDGTISASAETGIMSRQRTGDALDRKTTPGVWELALRFTSLIRESEL